MEGDPEPRYGSHGTVLAPHHESIQFRNVSFAYEPGHPVLRDVNLAIRHGEVFAIVGRTGCGKTTLASLVPRFFEPTEGAVLIDGTDTRQVTLRSLRDQIAIVPQETMLFADTVATNIAIGAPGADRRPPDRTAIVAAARAAHADAFIERLPQGYDTILGEHATTLSGGERQRLALARAIIRNPAILVLDEATSSLDEETQQLVQEALQAFVRGRTTLLIAHRLSTLAIAHRIAVMDAGRIVDVGTHAELLERCSLYRRFRDVGLE
jgi:ABC-type multidrug transport system fused ATPase/permease subunit